MPVDVSRLRSGDEVLLRAFVEANVPELLVAVPQLHHEDRPHWARFNPHPNSIVGHTPKAIQPGDRVIMKAAAHLLTPVKGTVKAVSDLKAWIMWDGGSDSVQPLSMLSAAPI